MTRFGVSDWDGAVRALSVAPQVVVACHVNPDGDALGSLFAAALGLRQLGKSTTTTWGDDVATVPPSYTFLPGAEDIVQPSEVTEATAFLALDCGAVDRLGNLESVAGDASVVINVDHHPGNDNFGTHNIVVTEASSTAELVHGLLEDLGVKIDGDIATCIYTGVITDTGRFTYANTRPDTHRLAAELIEQDVPVAEMADQIFDSAPFAFLKLTGRMLERAMMVAEQRLVYSWITQEDLVETGLAMNETDKLIDHLRAAREAEVAAIFKQQEDGAYRVSMRSRGPASVGEIARLHGGGGHELAAGFTAASIEEGVHVILDALSKRPGPA